MHVNYYACICAVHDASSQVPGVIPLPICFNLWKPLISAVAPFSQILKPWGRLGSEAGNKGWLTSNVTLTGEKNHSWERTHTADFKDLSDAEYLLNYQEVYSEKKNYISQEKRDIFVFAFLTLGFLTLCQRGGIHTHQSQHSAGGSDTLLAMENSKWCKPTCAHLQAQPQTYPLADSFWFVSFSENISTYTPTTKVLFRKTFPSVDF